MEFGRKLRSILEFEGLSQKEFAEKINVHPSTLNGYINDGKQPDFELLKRIAAALEVSTDYLLDYDNGEKPQGPPLSEEELALLTSFRGFSREKREVIAALVKMLSEK